MNRTLAGIGMRALVVASVLGAAPVAAATETAGADLPENVASEILVTAQKRSEDIQSVPISVAAFSGAALARQNVFGLLDLGRVAPGFQAVRSSVTSATRLSVRGVGSIGNTLIEPSVAVFLDGVYVPRSGSMLGTLLDLDSVEVLRGPQGTLFGRNASVGALVLRSAAPIDRFAGSVTAELGSFGRHRLSGTLNLPLADGLALRLAGTGQEYRGPWHNRLDGRRYGGADDLAFRATLQAERGALEWTLRGDYSRTRGDGVANFDLDPASVSPDSLARAQAAYAGGPDTNLSDRQMNYFANVWLRDSHRGLASTAVVALGGSSLKLINSVRRWNNDQRDGDVLYFPVDVANRRSLFASTSQNHELQFSSPEREWLGGRVDLVAGAYYFAEDYGLAETLDLGTRFCSVLISGAAERAACSAYRAATGGLEATRQDVTQRVKSLAFYGQGNVHLSEDLSLTLGGRWSRDRKRGAYAQLSSPFTLALRAPEVLTLPSLAEQRFTWRVNLSWRPSADVMLFANRSTGYKSGGYNSGGGTPALSLFSRSGSLVSTQRLFGRETVENTELGLRSQWLDQALRTNLTFYRMDIAGFQDRAFDGISFTVRNAGALRQQGFELDLVMAPVRAFAVTASLAHLDSRFTAYPNAASLPGLTGTQDLTGKPNTFSPKWSGTVALDWSGDLGNSGLGWALNGTLSFLSDQFIGLLTDANPQTLADGYALLGARLALHGPDNRWTAALFGRNLANVHYRSLAFYQPRAAALGFTNTVFSGSTALRVAASEPRSYGASLAIRF